MTIFATTFLTTYGKFACYIVEFQSFGHFQRTMKLPRRICPNANPDTTDRVSMESETREGASLLRLIPALTLKIKVNAARVIKIKN